MKNFPRLLVAAVLGAAIALSSASLAQKTAPDAPTTARQAFEIAAHVDERFDRLEKGLDVLSARLNTRLETIEDAAQNCANR